MHRPDLSDKKEMVTPALYAPSNTNANFDIYSWSKLLCANSALICLYRLEKNRTFDSFTLNWYWVICNLVQKAMYRWFCVGESSQHERQKSCWNGPIAEHPIWLMEQIMWPVQFAESWGRRWFAVCYITI